MTDRRDVLIAGCGDLGSRFGRLLAAEGDRVVGLRRSPRRLPPEIEGLAADLGDPASLSRALRKMPARDVVAYCAAADDFTDAAYRRAYVDGLRHVLEVVSKASAPPRFLLVSSTSVYAQADGSWVDETSPAEPTHFSGQRIREGEELLADAGRRGLVRPTVLRLAGIYGPGRTRLVDSVRDGKASASESTWTNRIHVDDAARALQHLANLGAPADLYLGVDHEPARDAEVKRWLAERLGVPAPPVAPTETSETTRALRSNKRCSNQRLLASGFTFLYPDFRAGYAALSAR